MRRTNIYLDDAMLGRLDEVASVSGTNRSDVIRSILERELENLLDSENCDVGQREGDGVASKIDFHYNPLHQEFIRVQVSGQTAEKLTAEAYRRGISRDDLVQRELRNLARRYGQPPLSLDEFLGVETLCQDILDPEVMAGAW
jgi:predicted DNA-binding protein